MDDQKMEDSKLFLAETDEEFARKSAYVKMAPFYTKSSRLNTFWKHTEQWQKENPKRMTQRSSVSTYESWMRQP